MTHGLKALFVSLMICSVLVSAEHTRRWFHGLPTDLRAFYAAGQVVDRHGDPFTVQPLLDHERALVGAGTSQPIVAPVPLPSYDLAAFSALALLPVTVAAACIAALTLAAGFVTAFALYRAAGIPLTLAIAVSFTATVYSASALGQIAPLAIAAIALGAWAVRERRYTLAGAALAVGLVQPQIGAAPFIALACFVPAARLAALCCALAAVVTGIAVAGPETAAYASVLHLHALAEVRFPPQLSLTWLLGFFGVAPALALGLGGASSLIAVVAALGIVARHREAAVANGGVVTLPAAFAVVGGSFLHEHQLALAIVPGLLALRARPSLVDSSWAFAPLTLPFLALLTLEPRWPKVAAYPSILLAVLVCWALIYARGTGAGRAGAARKATLVTGVSALVFLLLAKARPLLAIDLPPVVPIARENASIEWAIFCNAAAAAFHAGAYPLFVKIPVWASAVTIAVCSARNIGLRDRAPGSEVVSCT